MLTLSGITVRFGGISALNDMSLEALDREVVGILGPNGAGKVLAEGTPDEVQRNQAVRDAFLGERDVLAPGAP